MKLDIIKAMRRNICRAVGHDYDFVGWLYVCRRCKKKEDPLPPSSPLNIHACFPQDFGLPEVTEDMTPQIGDVKYDLELKCMVLYDGKEWIQCK